MWAYAQRGAPRGSCTALGGAPLRARRSRCIRPAPPSPHPLPQCARRCVHFVAGGPATRPRGELAALCARPFGLPSVCLRARYARLLGTFNVIYTQSMKLAEVEELYLPHVKGTDCVSALNN